MSISAGVPFGVLSSPHNTAAPPANGDGQQVPTAFRFRHIPALDGLRGLACLMVIAIHMKLPTPGGFLGVDLFFVLSGFLITALMLQEWDQNRTVNLKKFYLRRVLRLYPAMLVMFAIVLAFCMAVLTREEYRQVRKGIVVSLLAQANNSIVIGPLPFMPFAYTWSLSIEDKFYLIWPLVLCGLLSQESLSRRWKAGLVAVSILVCAALRARMYYCFPQLIGALYSDAVCRADSMLVGCLTAMLAVWNLLPSAPWFRTATKVASQVFLACLTYLMFYGDLAAGHLYYGTFTLIALGTAVVIINLIRSDARGLSAVLEHPLLTGTGRMSYGLYLWHVPVIIYFKRFHHPLTGHANYAYPESSTTYVVGILAVIYLIAGISYVFVEKPFLRLKPKVSHARLPIPAEDRAPAAAESALRAA